MANKKYEERESIRQALYAKAQGMVQELSPLSLKTFEEFEKAIDEPVAEACMGKTIKIKKKVKA